MRAGGNHAGRQFKAEAVRAAAEGRPADSANATHELHRGFLDRFAGELLAAGREAHGAHGRCGVCVAFADMTAAMAGAKLRALLMPRDQVLQNTRTAAAPLLDTVTQMLDGYDPATGAVVMLFDASGALHPWQISAIPADPADPAGD